MIRMIVFWVYIVVPLFRETAIHTYTYIYTYKYIHRCTTMVSLLPTAAGRHPVERPSPWIGFTWAVCPVGVSRNLPRLVCPLSLFWGLLRPRTQHKVYTRETKTSGFLVVHVLDFAMHESARECVIRPLADWKEVFEYIVLYFYSVTGNKLLMRMYLP